MEEGGWSCAGRQIGGNDIEGRLGVDYDGRHHCGISREYVEFLLQMGFECPIEEVGLVFRAFSDFCQRRGTLQTLYTFSLEISSDYEGHCLLLKRLGECCTI